MNLFYLNSLFWLCLIIMTAVAIVIVLYPLLKLKNNNFRSPKLLLLVGGVFIAVFSGLVYWYSGSSSLLSHYWASAAQARAVQAEMAKIKNPQQIIDELTSHLAEHPDSAQGWYLLGRLYLGLQQYSQALVVMQKAHQLKLDNETYAVGYAEAQFFAHQRHLLPDALTLLTQIVNRDPQNVSAINLLAINAYVQKNYQQAIQYWQQLLPFFPADSADSQELLKMIGQAQQLIHNTVNMNVHRLGQAQHLISNAVAMNIHRIVQTQHLISNAVAIQINVSLALPLKQSVRDDDTVYIFALDAQGTPMPIAVAKKRVGDLPITVTLNNQNMMIPGRSLQPNEKVQLIARISKHADPMPQVGDLQSSPIIMNIHTGKNSAVLAIDHVMQ